METQQQTEHEQVTCWRLNVLLDWYPQEVAEELAGLSHVDLHKAVEIRKQGCDPSLARDILA